MSAAVKATSASEMCADARFQRQCVFEFVRQFAEFAETARGRVALQGVHGAADAAHNFSVARMLFQLQRLVVQRLQQFLRGLEEELPQFRAALVGNGSRLHLDPLIRGAAVAVDHVELVGQPQQALRVPHEQIAVRDSGSDRTSRPAASARPRRSTSSRCGRK